MMSRTFVVASLPSATARTAMSRSVMTPTRRSFSPTGSAPASISAMIRAASRIDSLGFATRTSRVIASLTFMGCSSKNSCRSCNPLRTMQRACHDVTPKHSPRGAVWPRNSCKAMERLTPGTPSRCARTNQSGARQLVRHAARGSSCCRIASGVGGIDACAADS